MMIKLKIVVLLVILFLQVFYCSSCGQTHAEQPTLECEQDSCFWGEDNYDIGLKHKAYIKGDTIQLSGVEILGYKDFNGCRIVDNYNIIDSCYMEIGDDKTIDVYHLAILSLSPEKYAENEESDRLLLSIVNGQPRIYDNVLVNNDAAYSYECERFVFPTEEMASFNSEYDFALEYWGGQGYKIGWNIGIKAKGENLYESG